MADSPREHLTAAAAGLQFTSGSGAPFEYVEAPLPPGGVLTAETVGAAFGEGGPAEERTVAEFLADHVEDADADDAAAQQQVSRFRKLQEEITLHLHDPYAYCFGEATKRCYIVGAAGDQVAGLRTTVRET